MAYIYIYKRDGGSNNMEEADVTMVEHGARYVSPLKAELTPPVDHDHDNEPQTHRIPLFGGRRA